MIAAVATLAFGWTEPAVAHCDTPDGLVVAAARKALDTGNVNLVLIWVQKRDEAETSAYVRVYALCRTPV
jgi:hypothetical protein